MLRRVGPAPVAAGLVGGSTLAALAAGASVAAVATGFSGLLLACVLAILDSHAAAAHPELLVGDTPGHAATRARLGKAPALTRRYRPAPGLRNAHLTTVLPSFFRPHPPGVSYRRECVRMTDGGHVTLDWLADDAGVHAHAPPLSPSSPVVLLLSGIAGGSGDAYVQQFVHLLRRAGLRPVCFNSRGCAGSPVTAPQFYSASWTGDLRAIVPHVAAAHPGARLLAAGWSLGANILCNYLGEEGLASRPAHITAAISFCNPFALDVCDKALERGMGLSLIHI
jgi:predicted alpha/beta-fold hydrolase